MHEMFQNCVIIDSHEIYKLFKEYKEKYVRAPMNILLWPWNSFD